MHKLNGRNAAPSSLRQGLGGAPLALTALLLWGALGAAACKDNKASTPDIKPVGPAGAGLTTEGPASAERGPGTSLWPAPTVTASSTGGQVILFAKATASPPADVGDEEAGRLAAGKAQMLAQRALLKDLEKLRGKLPGSEIPSILKKLEVVEMKEREGGARTVVYRYVLSDATTGANKASTGAAPKLP